MLGFPSSGIVLVIALLFGAGSWFYLYGIFLPFHQSHEQAGVTWNHRSDLYPRWVGTRELLLNGRNPYGAEVTREIEMGYYGRPADEAKATAPRDEQRFIYPLFVVFLFAPTVLMPFSSLQVGGWIILFVVTLAALPLWTMAAGWRYSARELFVGGALVLGSWPVAEGLYMGQLSLLVAFFLAVGVAAMARGWGTAGGMLLAASLMKPQLSLPLLGWLLIRAACNWRQEKRFLGGFAASAFFLLAGSEALLPHWFWYWRTSLPAYIAYTGSRSSLERILGPEGGAVAAFVVAGSAGAVCWGLRKQPVRSGDFFYSVCLVLCVTLLLLPTWLLASYNDVLFIPAILWIWMNRGELTRTAARKVLALLFGIALIWGPVAELVLSARVLILRSPVEAESVLSIPQLFFFVLPVIVLALLLVVRPRAGVEVDLAEVQDG